MPSTTLTLIIPTKYSTRRREVEVDLDPDDAAKLPNPFELVVANTSSDVAVWSMAQGHECPFADIEGKSHTNAARFYLERHHDPTGVSGTGRVAEGWLFGDGVVVVRWVGEFGTTTIHHKGMRSVEALHCHNGATSIVWPDHQPVDLPELGCKLVWRGHDATPFRSHGWLVSLSSVEGDPDAWNAASDEGGEQSQQLRHGDHLCTIDWQVIELERADRIEALLRNSLGKLACEEIQVSRCIPACGGGPAAVRIYVQELAAPSRAYTEEERRILRG